MSGAWTVEERRLDLGEVRLRALVEGPVPARDDVETLLVLHGFTGCAESMERVSVSLRDRYRVVRLDLVGHGLSDAPEAEDSYRMSVCARHIAGAAESLGLERPHLLGYSMGGRAAIAAAVAAPDRFASLVLVGATAGIADPALRRARIEADRALADRIEREGIESFVDEWMALPIFASQARLGRDALEAARRQRLRNRPHGLANSLRGMGAGAQPPLFERLKGFEAPVLLVVGAEDAKFREIAAALERLLPDARTAVLDGAGHAAHLEAPDAFGEVVAAFLERAGSRHSIAALSGESALAPLPGERA